MWTNLDRYQKTLILALSLGISSSILILNFQFAFSQNVISYLDVNSTSTAQLSKFSVAAWFKTSTDYNSNAFIVNKAGASDNMNYGIWMTNAEKVGAGFETSSGNDIFATSPLSYSDGKWHYAVVTFDGTTITLYLDGLPVGTRIASGIPDSGGEEPIRMGANSDGLSNFFVGNVDEIRVWNAALTAQQVADAYNGKFDTKGQIEYLDFSEPIVSSNNTAQINGTVTNQTGIQDINGTVTNQTGIQDINGTVSNETSTISDLSAKNDTGIVNNTLQNIPPIEIPQTTNDTGIANDSSTQNRQKAPEENNSPESFDQSVSVDQEGQVAITLEATDEDNDQLQFDITADPLQGRLTGFDKEKGTVTYVPQNGYSGNDKFSFKVVDNKSSESNIADVDVNVKEVVSSNEKGQNETNNAVQSIKNTTGIQEDTKVIPAQQPNMVPKADAGDDQKVEVNTEVKLDGGKSSDEDGKIVSYKWEQTDGPEVDIKQADKQTATFDVPESAADSKLVFKLTVVDDKGDSASDDVSAEVHNTQAQNTDNTQAQNTDNTQAQNTDNTQAQNTDNTQAQNTDNTQAQNTDNTQAQNTDNTQAQNTDNTQAQNTDNTQAQNTDNTQAQNTDNTQAQNTDNTQTQKNTQVDSTQLNVPPKADAGDDQKVEVNTEVKLDGGKSSDEDGKIASYKWEQTDGPEVDIKQADKQTATFDVPESAADSKLVFKLTVVDDKGDSASDDVTIDVSKVQNVPPKADAGDDQKAEVNTEVKLDGGKSSDEDGKIASHKWEQTDGPEVDIKQADKQTATFDVPESAADSKLVFKLTVVDDKGDSASDDVTIDVSKVQNVPPKADAGDDQKVEVNTEVKLDGGKSSDEDGKIASYKWEQTDGPEVDIKQADKQTATFEVSGTP